MTVGLKPEDCPYLPRGVRVHADKVRGRTVLLAPEKVLELDEPGVAILSRVDGQSSMNQIVTDLAAAYDAPPDQIEADVQRFLGTLRARMYLMVRQ